MLSLLLIGLMIVAFMAGGLTVLLLVGRSARRSPNKDRH
jgi:hypothetical protein